MNNNNPKGERYLDTKKQDPQVEDTELPQVEEAESKPQEAAEEPTALEQLEEEYRQLNDRYLRTLAEYDNFRKRSSKEREAIYPEAKADTVKEFLTVADSFSRALSFECAEKKKKKGMEMIHTTLLGAFQKLGVEAFGKPGETFDPSLHNAVMHVEDDSLGENTIAEVFQEGYRMGDKVLRYAMVKVAN